MPPPLPGSAGRRFSVERRVNLERRVAERRFHVVPVNRERRRHRDRRDTFDRRETASGHIRNAIQLLEVGDVDGAAHDAIERLQMALREVDRLSASRRSLGERIRRLVADRGLARDP